MAVSEAGLAVFRTLLSLRPVPIPPIPVYAPWLELSMEPMPKSE